jgi:hypothetical protein
LVYQNTIGEFLQSFQPPVSRYGTITFGDFVKGEIVVAGDFIKINGIETYGIARLDNKGTVDDSFIFTDVKKEVRQVKILNDGNIMISTGKEFFKLNSDAVVQPDFNFTPFKSLHQVIKFIILDDQKIVVSDPNNPYRLNPDGTEDTSFDIGSGIDIKSSAFDFDVQADKKVIFGSRFTEFNGTPVNRVVRINSDGSLDQTFDIGEGPDDRVTFAKVLKDDNVLIGGFFKHFDGIEVPHGLVKLSKNGEVDSTFLENQKEIGQFDWGIMNIKAVQIGHKVFLKSRYFISLLNTDGTVDEDFNFPITFNGISDIIAFEDPGNEPSAGGRVSAENDFLFFMGSFIDREDDSPAFLLKVNLNNSSDLVTGVAGDKDTVNPFLLYPNPVQSNMFINYQNQTGKPVETGKVNIAIYNTSGNAVYKKQYINTLDGYPLEVNVEGLNAGIYLIHFFSENKVLLTAKFVKK